MIRHGPGVGPSIGSAGNAQLPQQFEIHAVVSCCQKLDQAQLGGRLKHRVAQIGPVDHQEIGVLDGLNLALAGLFSIHHHNPETIRCRRGNEIDGPLAQTVKENDFWARHGVALDLLTSRSQSGRYKTVPTLNVKRTSLIESSLCLPFQLLHLARIVPEKILQDVIIRMLFSFRHRFDRNGRQVTHDGGVDLGLGGLFKADRSE